jgi:hypothetical protein
MWNLAKKTAIAAAAVIGCLLGWKAFEKASTPEMPRAEQIEQWLAETREYRGFPALVPRASDKEFWDSVPKPSELPLPNEGEYIPLDVACEQFSHYGNKKWLLAMAQEMQYILNDPKSNITDLATMETVANLAHALALAEPRLPPELVEETKRVIRDRGLNPIMDGYRKSQHRSILWNKDQTPWIGMSSNWVAVCWAYAVYAALIIEDDKTAAELIAAAEESMEEYLKTFEEDGYLPAGIRYWNYGFSHYLFLAETLLAATGGEINLYTHPKIAKIAAFPLKWNLNGPEAAGSGGGLGYYPTFRDNNNPTETAWNAEAILKERTLWPHETAGNNLLANSDEKLLVKTARLSAQNTPWPDRKKLPIEIPEGDYKNTIRIQSESDPKLILAVQSSPNDGEHTHLESGAYTLFQASDSENGGGRAWLGITGDQGGPNYSKENQGGEKEREAMTGPWGHPIPEIDGQTQAKRPTKLAKVLSRETTGDSESVLMDMLPAYTVPGLKKLMREIKMDKKTGEVSVKDSFESTRPMILESPVITSFGGQIIEDALKIHRGQGYSISAKNMGPPQEETGENRGPDAATLKRWVWKTAPVQKGSIEYTIEPTQKGKK